MNITRKILREHLLEGELEPGEEIAIKIDQTLTQDATGTMAYLELEAMGVPEIKTELSVSYVDHNTLQTDFRNADDHRYLQSVAIFSCSPSFPPSQQCSLLSDRTSPLVPALLHSLQIHH